MNISHIPTSQLMRASVISIIDRDRPVIESFTNGEGVCTVVSLHGVPIPYSIFILHMAVRMAPMVSAKYLREDTLRSTDFVTQSMDILLETWKRAELPEEIKALLATGCPPALPAPIIVKKLVADLFDRLIVANAETTRASFRELVIRMDEDYISSLVDPILV
jgi:hypothetical protein